MYKSSILMLLTIFDSVIFIITMIWASGFDVCALRGSGEGYRGVRPTWAQQGQSANIRVTNINSCIPQPTNLVSYHLLLAILLALLYSKFVYVCPLPFALFLPHQAFISHFLHPLSRHFSFTAQHAFWHPQHHLHPQIRIWRYSTSSLFAPPISCLPPFPCLSNNFSASTPPKSLRNNSSEGLIKPTFARELHALGQPLNLFGDNKEENKKGLLELLKVMNKHDPMVMERAHSLLDWLGGIPLEDHTLSSKLSDNGAALAELEGNNEEVDRKSVV